MAEHLVVMWSAVQELFANIDLRTRTVVEWQDELRERWLEQPQS